MNKYYQLKYQELAEDTIIIKYFKRKRDLDKFIKGLPKCLKKFEIVRYKGNYNYDFTLAKNYIKFEVPVRYILK